MSLIVQWSPSWRLMSNLVTTTLYLLCCAVLILMVRSGRRPRRSLWVLAPAGAIGGVFVPIVTYIGTLLIVADLRQREREAAHQLVA